MLATSDAHLTSQNRQPCFLYLRGRIFYYRRRMPKKFVASGCPREIRICLRTSYQVTGRKLAVHLHALTEQMLEKWQMDERTDIPGIAAQVDAFRAMLRDEVNAILSDKAPKSPISTQELQKRLNVYLRQKLDEDLAGTDLAPVAEFHAPDKPVETITLADSCESKASQIQSELLSGENYDDNFNNAIIELTKLGVLKPSEITPENAQAIVKAFMIIQVKFNKILASRYNGDYTLEQQLCPQTADNALHMQDVTKQSQESQQVMLLSELIEQYIDTNIADGKWKKQTIADHKNRITSLQVIIGDKIITEYSRTDIRHFRDTLLKLPVNWRKKINNNKISLDSLIDSSQNALAIKTVNTNVEAVSSMFSWAVNEGYLSSNPAKGLALKDEQPDIEKRQAFTQEDIRHLFFSGDYSQNRFSKPSYYWVPLIALYTGMRLEEICQLHCEDIYEENGLYVIDIRPDSKDGLNDKLIKTKNAVRKIPIHNKLIELGFIQYHANLVKNGEIRLFPELNKTEKSPKYGKQVGKQFRAWVKEKQISGDKSFHSLRHSFSDFFKKRNLHTDMFREVFGHENAHLAGRQYGNRFSPKEIYDALISKLDYGEKKTE